MAAAAVLPSRAAPPAAAPLAALRSPTGAALIAGTVLASGVASYDAYVVNVAVPAITQRFDASVAAIQWTLTSYLLAVAALLLIAGALADRFGRRRVLLAGLVVMSAGSILCAAVAPLLLTTPWGWRSVYFVGIAPLVIVGYARRNLRETQRFEDQAKSRAERGFAAILSGPYRRRVLLMGLVWALIYSCTQNAITFWKEFAVGERGFSDAEIRERLSFFGGFEGVLS